MNTLKLVQVRPSDEAIDKGAVTVGEHGMLFGATSRDAIILTHFTNSPALNADPNSSENIYFQHLARFYDITIHITDIGQKSDEYMKACLSPSENKDLPGWAPHIPIIESLDHPELELSVN